MFLIHLIILTGSYAMKQLLPYGAHPLMLSFYNPSDGKFFCRNGEGPFPMSYINDDYCDCEADGSDEPGTSACRNAFLYCPNEGFIPQNVSSRLTKTNIIDDGICDCCDGSDEPQKRIECNNTCAQLSREMARKKKEDLRVLERGLKLKEQWITEKRLRFESIDEEITSLLVDQKNASENKRTVETARQQADDLVKQLKVKFQEKEHEDRMQRLSAERRKLSDELFDRLDLNKDGILTEAELEATSELRTLFDDPIKWKILTESMKDFVNRDIFFMTLYNMIKEFFEKSNNVDQSKDESVNEDSEYIHGKEDVPLEMEMHSEYDEETQIAISKLNELEIVYNDATNRLESIDEKLKKLNEMKSIDFGTNGEFFELYDKSYTFSDSDYAYVFRPFNRVDQQGLHGGHSVLMGEFQQWLGGQHKVMEYTRGVVCPNGKSRRCEVRFKCGIENRIVSVDEPDRCVYVVHFESPAACGDDQSEKDSSHDEL
ncbi:hypothetical protein ACOME3_002112 [Neoechinorhynchus agilis]